jgi:hypothetical protein
VFFLELVGLDPLQNRYKYIMLFQLLHLMLYYDLRRRFCCLSPLPIVVVIDRGGYRIFALWPADLGILENQDPRRLL